MRSEYQQRLTLLFQLGAKHRAFPSDPKEGRQSVAVARSAESFMLFFL